MNKHISSRSTVGRHLERHSGRHAVFGEQARASRNVMGSHGVMASCRAIIGASLFAMCAMSEITLAGPTYLEQIREISLSIPDDSSPPRVDRIAAPDFSAFEALLNREQRRGTGPANNDGAYGLVSHNSYLDNDGIAFSGRIEADTLYSTDGRRSGVAALVNSSLHVRFSIDQPADAELSSFVTRFDDLRPEPLSMTLSLRDTSGEVITAFTNFGLGQKDEKFGLNPGTYSLFADVVPQGYGGEGQWSLGDYSASLRLVPLPLPSTGALRPPQVAIDPAVIPLPPQAWTAVLILGAVMVIIARR